MFIRVRKTANGNTCYQLVRSYRDATGAVRQETVSVSAATVAESLDNAIDTGERSSKPSATSHGASPTSSRTIGPSSKP